jgi:hypothetical protein
MHNYTKAHTAPKHHNPGKGMPCVPSQAPARDRDTRVALQSFKLDNGLAYARATRQLRGRRCVYTILSLRTKTDSAGRTSALQRSPFPVIVRSTALTTHGVELSGYKVVALGAGALPHTMEIEKFRRNLVHDAFYKSI